MAFYGRAGNALCKSFKRLNIDPLVVYGTLCVKCPVADPSLAGGECIERIVEELAIVQPRIVVVMGERGAGDAERGRRAALAHARAARGGDPGASRPTIDALYIPDIDDSLDSEEAKREFWAAFRALGEWYSELPPY